MPGHNKKLLEYFNKVEKKHWWWEGRRTLMKFLLGNEHPKRILDIGCGTGETLSFLKTLFPQSELYGIDRSSQAVAYTRKRDHKKVYKGKAEVLPFKKDFFDIVLFLDVLEHVKDQKKALLEAKRVLKPGGKILITAPAVKFIWSLHDEMQGHYRRYTRHEIKQLANEAGLKILFDSYFNFFLSPLIGFIRIISNVETFEFLVNYNSDVNFKVSDKKLLNLLLTVLFNLEIKLLSYVKYPFGISIVALLSTTGNKTNDHK